MHGQRILGGRLADFCCRRGLCIILALTLLCHLLVSSFCCCAPPPPHLTHAPSSKHCFRRANFAVGARAFMALAAQLLHGSISTAACFEMGVGSCMRAILVAALRLMERQSGFLFTFRGQSRMRVGTFTTVTAILEHHLMCTSPVCILKASRAIGEEGALFASPRTAMHE